MCVVRVANCNWQFDMSKEGVSWLSAHVVKYRCTIVKAPVIAVFLKHVYFYEHNVCMDNEPISSRHFGTTSFVC